MSGNTMCLLGFLLLPMASSMTLDSSSAHVTMFKDASDGMDASDMEKVFARSREQQRQSMDVISKSMTQSKALEVIQSSTYASDPKLKQITGLLSNRQSLRKALGGADGFGGLDGARLLLNDMIHEVMLKYDAEIAKCTSYYAAQCALMEVARGQISAANYIAATARALIMDSQAMINHCEISIPEIKGELKDHLLKCKMELMKHNAKLKIILGDIAVMTMILEMSDCDSTMLQMKKLTMLKCHDQCTKKTSVSFNHGGLDEKVKQLKSPAAQDLMTETFADMFDDDDSNSEVALFQVDGSEYMKVVPNITEKTKFNNPPTPRTKVPSNPCTDPNLGAPAPPTKRGGKCTLKKSPRCYKLQARFLQIQAEIADSRDELMDEISKLEDSCAETKKTLESAINNDGALLASSQTKLGTAMEKEASAGETGRQVAKENQQYNDDLVKQMKTCSTNYGDFENEMCALKKIRGDLFKKMKPGHPGFFQDCEVSPWAPEECTKTCAGGDQKLTRSVLTHPNGGCKCLPLTAEKRCNLHPCPINCRLAEWGGWSKCSAKCGGGMANRVRDVKTPMQYDGKQCGSTSEAKPCNVDACEKDCDLLPWSRWTSCTKHCDGGTMKRERFIINPAEGSGTCADKWDPSRLQYQPCATHRCEVPWVDGKPTVLACNRSMDVILVVDGTPNSGEEGFKAEIKGAKKLVGAWSGPGLTATPGFALIHYTGPKTWTGVSQCTGKSTKNVDMEATCKITLVQHFTDDLERFENKLDDLKFQQGSKLLSLALMTVQSEFALGNKDYRTVVVVFVDGAPLSFRKTLLASRAIRKKARLVWVVVTKFSPLKDIKTWASRRWQENIVIVPEYTELERSSTATHIVANICPKVFPTLKVKRIEGGGELPPLDLMQK